MKTRKYTEDSLLQACKNNYSISGILKELGIVAAGGNYQTIKKAINFFKIDTSHFTGQGHYKNKTHNNNTRNLEKILVYGKYENTFNLKKRLLKENIKESKCENCGMEKWLGMQIPLELHHIDGDKINNQLSNIKILCPNCHALTENYRGKNKK